MNLKIIGKNSSNYTEFEQTIELPYDLLYEITLSKRIIFSQKQLSNQEILDNLIEEMKAWEITCEQINGYMIFKKGNKLCELLDITNSEEVVLDSLYYKNFLSNFIKKQLL